MTVQVKTQTNEEIIDLIRSGVASEVEAAGFAVIDTEFEAGNWQGILVGLTKQTISRIDVTLAFSNEVWWPFTRMRFESGKVALVWNSQAAA